VYVLCALVLAATSFDVHAVDSERGKRVLMISAGSRSPSGFVLAEENAFETLRRRITWIEARPVTLRYPQKV
jgi:hypothetical protein